MLAKIELGRVLQSRATQLLAGYLGFDIVMRAIEKCNKFASPNLVISSTGGSWTLALELIEAIQRNGNVTAFVIGECWSSAFVIASACRKRRITKNADFMAHGARRTVDSQTMERMKAGEYVGLHEIETVGSWPSKIRYDSIASEVIARSFRYCGPPEMTIRDNFNKGVDMKFTNDELERYGWFE